MLSMGERMIVSGGGLLRVYSVPEGRLVNSAPLAGSGALCCGNGRVYCACGRGGTVFALDADTLTPRMMFAGGPGVCSMAYACGRVYTLCGEGDGVLMLDGETGSPLVFVRAGLSPAGVSLADDGSLIVAGGEGSDVTCLCPHTLHTSSRNSMPWPVVSAVSRSGCRFALCMNDALLAELIVAGRDGSRQSLLLPGMPGALAYDEKNERVLAAVCGGIYAIWPQGLRIAGFSPLPGSAGGVGSRLILGGGHVFFLDAACGVLWALLPGKSLLVCRDAADAALLDT